MMPNLFKRTATKRILFFIVADIFSVVIAVWLAFLIRFDGVIPPQYFPFLPRIMILAVLFIVPVFYVRKLYSFSWSYVSAGELISLFISTTAAFIMLSGAIFVSNYFPHFLNFPRSTIFVSYVLVFIFCSLTRFSKRVYLHSLGFKRMGNKERTLIVGAGDAGEQILRNIFSSKNNNYFPVGFADDNPLKQGVKIHGCKVLGTISDIPKIVEENQLKQVIIALPSANNKVITQAIDLARLAGVRKIKIAPQLNQIISGQVSLKNLKDVDVEDLLGRETIQLDKKQLDNFIRNKTVLITGAAGSIGSELSRQIARFNPSLLILLDQDETGIFDVSRELAEKFTELKIQPLVRDVTDQKSIRHIFGAHQPQLVFHAAAYKHVPLMEAQPGEAVKNNVFGTWNLAAASLEFGVEKFIFISTDKAINPTSIMGSTKRIGEMICQASGQQNKTSFISVRFGNVLNSRGSVIPIFKEQIRRGGPVQVTHKDMKRYFMLTSEACLLVLQAGAMGKGGEVFVLDMGKPVMILDLAKEMIRLSGFKPDEDIAIVFTGRRPGEKLFEEIMTTEEGTLATQNQKIFTAKLSQINPADFNKSLEVLKEASASGDQQAIRKIIKELIPTFSPLVKGDVAE